MLLPVAALRAAAQCPLVLRGLMVEVEACALWAVRRAVLGEHEICTVLGEVLPEQRMALGLMGKKRK